MQPRNRLATVYLVAAGVLFLGIMLLQDWPPPPHKKATTDVVGLYAGALATAGLDKDVDVFAKIAEEHKQQFPAPSATWPGPSPRSPSPSTPRALAAEDRREARRRRPTRPS